MDRSQRIDPALSHSQSLVNGWLRVRFGDIAKKINNIIDRKTCDLSIYIAGKHMQTDDFRIKKWGSIGDGYLGPAFNQKFTKGQILYGSRRTYLRKVSIPHFDGICANTTYVIEPTGDILIPELLPFIMQSTSFTEYSVKMSKGSTNPYINWKDIACYELNIPNKEQQYHIFTLLRALEDCIVKNEQFIEEAERMKQVLMRELFSKGIGHTVFKEVNGFAKVPKEWDVIQAQTLLDDKIIRIIQDGNYGKQYPRSSDFSTVGLPFISAKHVSLNGEINFSCAPKLQEKCYSRLRISPALAGDVILTHNATVGRVGIVPDEIQKCFVSTTTTYYRLNSQLIDNYYLYYYMLTDFYQKQLIRVMKQSTRNQVPITAQKKLLIIIPPLFEQQQISGILTHCDNTINAARANFAAKKALKIKLINQFFSGFDN